MLAFGLELTVNSPIRLFFPAGGVPLQPSEVASTTEAAANDSASVPPPVMGDQMGQVLAAISTMQSLLHNFEVTVDCRLCDHGKAIAESVRRDLATGFQQQLDKVGLDFQKEIDKVQQGQQELHQRLQQVEQNASAPLVSGVTQSQPAASGTTTSDNGMSTSDSSLSALETYLPLAILLAVTNRARQNPKLIGQALSVIPPPLRFFWPRDSGPSG